MTLAELRNAFRDESLIERLTASAPPVTRTVQESGGRYEVLEEAEPADANGRNLSAAMVTLIGSITADMVFYSPKHPVRRALAEFDRLCRRRHRGGQWWDHAERPICGQMLWNHLADGASVLWCAGEYRVSWTRAERLLAAGKAFVLDRLEKAEADRLGVKHDPKTCDTCWRIAHESA